MPTLLELETDLNRARFDAQDWAQRFGPLSEAAQMGRERLQKAEAAYRTELLAMTSDF